MQAQGLLLRPQCRGVERTDNRFAASCGKGCEHWSTPNHSSQFVGAAHTPFRPALETLRRCLVGEVRYFIVTDSAALLALCSCFWFVIRKLGAWQLPLERLCPPRPHLPSHTAARPLPSRKPRLLHLHPVQVSFQSQSRIVGLERAPISLRGEHRLPIAFQADPSFCCNCHLCQPLIHLGPPTHLLNGSAQEMLNMQTSCGRGVRPFQLCLCKMSEPRCAVLGVLASTVMNVHSQAFRKKGMHGCTWGIRM